MVRSTTRRGVGERCHVDDAIDTFRVMYNAEQLARQEQILLNSLFSLYYVNATMVNELERIQTCGRQSG